MIALRPITRDEGDQFIRQHHRHHGVPVGALWRLGWGSWPISTGEALQTAQPKTQAGAP